MVTRLREGVRCRSLREYLGGTIRKETMAPLGGGDGGVAATKRDVRTGGDSPRSRQGGRPAGCTPHILLSATGSGSGVLIDR